MSLTELDQHIKQLFAYAELQRLQRLEEANIGFTFQEDDLYLRLAAEALALVQEGDLGEFQSELLVCAQAFERLAAAEFACVNRQSAGQLAAALYWLAIARTQSCSRLRSKHGVKRCRACRMY